MAFFELGGCNTSHGGQCSSLEPECPTERYDDDNDEDDDDEDSDDDDDSHDGYTTEGIRYRHANRSTARVCTHSAKPERCSVNL